MDIRSHRAVAGQLTRDTFRQARASGIGGIMLAVTAVCTLLCLSVDVSGDVTLSSPDEPSFFLPSPSARAAVPSVGGSAPPFKAIGPEEARREGVETVGGRMTLAFGAVSVPVSRERGDAVRFLELLLAGGVAGTLGVLLALVWTAGFVTSFLDPRAASVLLAKPVGRGELLLGKAAGVLAYVGVQASLFVVATWLALGVRTQVWDPSYLWCIPLLLLQFAVFYGASVLLAVVTRSTAACVVGSVLYWLLGWAINYGAVTARALPEPRYLSPATVALAEVAYWISPKPIDLGLILFDALESHRHFEKPAVFTLLEAGGAFSPHLSILSSLAIAGFLLGVAAHEFREAEY